ncbi:Methionine-R-sulfoxide reductase B1 [Sarcoptes scabiei]|nr:Methionine-R-sulfoxide reductase B1 [Sarcoptes scabiei]
MSSFGVDREALKQRLSSLEYNVTQNAITEDPFIEKFKEFWENDIYCCVICEQQLFTCGCGKLCSKPDHKKTPRIRTEIFCSRCDTYFGLFLNDLKRIDRDLIRINNQESKPKTGKRI